MKTTSLYLLVLLLTLISCSKDDLNNQHFNDDKVGFNIYRAISDTVAPIYYYRHGPEIWELRIEKEPWISEKDINFYDFSSHIIYLNKKLNLNHDHFTDFDHFIVTADGERIYSLVNWPLHMCSLPVSPYFNSYFLPEDMIRINYMYFNDSLDDPRDDIRIKSTLKNSNKFRAGISCELVNVYTSGSKLYYSIQIKNLEEEDLFVLDPDKLGVEQINGYFSNIRLVNGTKHYSPIIIHVDSEDITGMFSKNWYTRVAANSLIERTVIMENFPLIMDGTYDAYFTYNSPYNLEKEQREKEGTRIWMGSIETYRENMHVATGVLEDNNE